VMSPRNVATPGCPGAADPEGRGRPRRARVCATSGAGGIVTTQADRRRGGCLPSEEGATFSRRTRDGRRSREGRWVKTRAAKERLRLQLIERDGDACAFCGRRGGDEPHTRLNVRPRDPDAEQLTISGAHLLCPDCEASSTVASNKSVRYASSWMQGGFTMIPNVVLLNSELGYSAHRAYSILLFYARQDEKAWPRQIDEVRARFGFPDRTWREAIKELVAAGLVQMWRRGQGRSNVYVLLDPRAAESADQVQDGEIGRSEAADPADQERRDRPIPSDEDAGKQTQRHSWPKSVDSKPVTDQERELADGILAAWNAAIGAELQPTREYGRGIVMRIREHPDLTLEDHVRVITTRVRKKWWTEKRPGPRVLYGNATIFTEAVALAEEQSAMLVQDERLGDDLFRRTAERQAA
jgi:5-methylcytosine-specific restriction endonuclease McrA